MSAKVSASTPAAPPFRRTRLQASARKSSRHTLSISAWNRRPGSSLAFACNTLWSFRTFSDPGRLSPVVMPVLLPASLSNQGFFPPPALPGLRGTTSPSATLPAPACPSRGSGWCVPHHRQGFPCCSHPPLPCVPPPIPRRDQPGALVAHFPANGSLPQRTGGSAPAFQVSRPAQRSLALQPAWSLDRPRRPVPPKCFERCRYLHHPLRLLPAGATVCRAGFAPAEGRCLSTAHGT